MRLQSCLATLGTILTLVTGGALAQPPVGGPFGRRGESVLLLGQGSVQQEQKGKAPTATPPETLKLPRDFKAELLYSVPKEKHGSWVNLCVDPKGRLIVSDQNGPLYRVTPPPPGGAAGETKVELIDLPLGGAHGLLYAFDSLYVMVNEDVKIGGVKPKRGLHRARSKDGGDTFEKPEFLHAVTAAASMAAT